MPQPGHFLALGLFDRLRANPRRLRLPNLARLAQPFLARLRSAKEFPGWLLPGIWHARNLSIVCGM